MTTPEDDKAAIAAVERYPGCLALTGESHAYRVPVGNYRIVYEVLDDRLVVQAFRLDHHRDVYRR